MKSLSSIRSRKSAHGWEKYTPPLNTTILMSQHWGHNYFHNKHKCLVTALSRCPLFQVVLSCLPSTFVVHVQGCLGAIHVEHRVLAWSLKWGYMSLPPLFLRQTRALAKTVWCWLHVVGIRYCGEVGEAQTLREKISILSPLTQWWEEAASLPRGKCIYVERKHRSV